MPAIFAFFNGLNNGGALYSLITLVNTLCGFFSGGSFGVDFCTF